MTEPPSGYDDARNDCACEIDESCALCAGDRLADMVDEYDPDVFG